MSSIGRLSSDDDDAWILFNVRARKKIAPVYYKFFWWKSQFRRSKSCGLFLFLPIPVYSQFVCNYTQIALFTTSHLDGNSYLVGTGPGSRFSATATRR